METCIKIKILIAIMQGTNSMVSDMDAMFFCIFNLCDVRITIVITCIVPRSNLSGPPEKKKSVSGGSFISVKSVKEELIECARSSKATCFNFSVFDQKKSKI